ncbi:hypothetical protein M501DRAFT_1002756 [Patellaria atrata CBS 101060]|uniref:Uncharacterized protein n=1 Tax=Patellaria atrata CBS 101060 TaxID=1346257 RepID=A0A9P4VUA2_9PEZI|nr:hypothetical protein M501DRAFT_1002756 [Patellaria atrata CBS 101060]
MCICLQRSFFPQKYLQYTIVRRGLKLYASHNLLAVPGLPVSPVIDLLLGSCRPESYSVMLSLPLVPPRDDHGFWHTSFSRSHGTTEHGDQHNHHNRPRSPHRNTQPPVRSSLAILTADEEKIEKRKQFIRRFGASWIRPPGVAKTYQATMDEIAEREEQDMLARREQAMMDLANAQELEAQRQAAAEGGEEDEEGEGERDLDDDVPEAEDLTFNEESLIEGSMLEHDVEHMLDMEEAEMEGVLEEQRDLERDLDDDVPEAGSYQHTDTELEDSSSEPELEEEEESFSNVRRGVGRSVLSEGDSSLLGGSSFVGSSPAARRGPAGGSAFRGRLMQGRPNGR